MLKEIITKDLVQAMKDKDTVKKAVLTVLKSNLQNEEIKLKRELTKDDELTILNRERKQIKDAIEGFTRANRHDLIEKEQLKLQIVESYLPKQLTKEEIIEVLKTKNIKSSDNAGQWIGVLSKELKGQAEGRDIAEAVRDYLNTLRV